MATASSPGVELHASRSSAVAVQRVPPEGVDNFLRWQREVTLAAEGFAGYRATDVFPPAAGRGDEWVVLIHFEDEPSLARWLDSPERARLVADLRSRGGNFEMKNLGDGFAPWFAGSGAPAADAPASWKMALTVLLALFPTVMLLTIFVGPLTSPLGLSVSMLIGNALSISILQWVVMPHLTKVLGPWLGGETSRRGGLVKATPVLLLLLLAVLAGLFRQLTG